MGRVLTSAMLSCPFCGCDDLETSPFPGNRERTFWICRCGNPTCAAEIQGPSAEEAARRWNRTVPKRDAAYVYREPSTAQETRAGTPGFPPETPEQERSMRRDRYPPRFGSETGGDECDR